MDDLIVVAGAGGFIGGHLVADLVRDGRRVRAIDCKLLAVIDVYEQEDVAGRLHATGAKLRLGCESTIRARGLQKHVQIAGRDCNLIFTTRDADGRRSQGFSDPLPAGAANAGRACH